MGAFLTEVLARLDDARFHILFDKDDVSGYIGEDPERFSTYVARGTSKAQEITHES
jgi:hypothetical protein